MFNSLRILPRLSCSLLGLLCWSTLAFSEAYRLSSIDVELNQPWGMTFITPTQLVVTEKSGHVQLISIDASKPPIKTTLDGGPKATLHGQGGLLDVEKHPQYSQNHWLYFSYTKQVHQGYTTAVARARLLNNSLTQLEDIFIARAVSSKGQHFGSRLAFDRDHRLYITVGDRGDRHQAQQLSTHAGKVIRINDDGSIPSDNPFINRSGALVEIYSYGHRNPQGLVYDWPSKRLWLHEHGPRGGDEVNLIRAGANYGWPVITYGREYSGFAITDETHRPGMEQPIWKWVPSIAPSGLAIYRGKAFPNWQGDLFVGALKSRLLAHLSMQEETVKREQRYLESLDARIRDVAVGPDGLIYLLTDSEQGRLLRLSP